MRISASDFLIKLGVYGLFYGGKRRQFVAM